MRCTRVVRGCPSSGAASAATLRRKGVTGNEIEIAPLAAVPLNCELPTDEPFICRRWLPSLATMISTFVSTRCWPHTRPAKSNSALTSVELPLCAPIRIM